MCLLQNDASGKKSTTFLYKGDEIAMGQTVKIRELDCFPLLLQETNDIFQNGDLLGMITPKVKVNGITYEKETALVYKWDEFTELVYIQIDNLFVIEKEIFAFCHLLVINDFINKPNAFCVKEGENRILCKISALYYKWPQQTYHRYGRKYVMLSNIHDCWYVE